MERTRTGQKGRQGERAAEKRGSEVVGGVVWDAGQGRKASFGSDD